MVEGGAKLGAGSGSDVDVSCCCAPVGAAPGVACSIPAVVSRGRGWSVFYSRSMMRCARIEERSSAPEFGCFKVRRPGTGGTLRTFYF